VRRLIERADIVVESFNPGRLASWGLDPLELRARRPGLVVTSLSSFGQAGPYARWRGSDLVFYAMSGIMQISGVAGREPLKHGLRQSLYCAGINAAYATVAAHYASLTTGCGAWLDVSVLECLSSELVMNLAYFISSGAVQSRRPPGGDPISPVGGGEPLPSADNYVALQISGAAPIERIAELFEDPALAGESFATSEGRLRNSNELRAILAGHLARETGREFFVRASEAGCLAGFVQGARDLLTCPQLQSRGVFHSFAEVSSEGHPIDFPAVMAELSRTPTAVRRRAPRLGEHTAKVVALLGAPERAVSTPRPAADGLAANTARHRRSEPNAGPLAGLRVLDLSYVFAAPYMGALLSDLGAEVIKVEAPHRLDQTRAHVSPFFENDPGEEYWNRAAAFHVVNRGKRSLSLNLATGKGRDVLRQLVGHADILLENYTPRVMREWQLTYDELAPLNPGLIMLSNTGYGSTGPWAGFRAQGTTLEATMGLSYYTGYRDGPPSKVGQSYPDFIACWTGLLCLFAALVDRHRTGRGQRIDLGMYQLGISVIPEAILSFQATREDLSRTGSEDVDAIISGVFAAAGVDRWVAISVATEAQLAALQAIVPDLRAAMRGTWGDELAVREAIERWSSGLSPHEAASRLQAAGVPAGAILDARDLLADPHLRERSFYEAVVFNDGRTRPLVGRPYRWHSEAGQVAIRRPGPDFAEANEYVLRDLLGLDEDHIAALYEDGAVTRQPVDPPRMHPAPLRSMLEAGTLARIDDDYQDVFGTGVATAHAADVTSNGHP
jgi:crotonobetainyl-CoA:carnitine CoA-transferase CaiB-like acyl-CoA transferase